MSKIYILRQVILLTNMANRIKIATPVSHLFSNREVGRRINGMSDLLEYRDHSPSWPVDGEALFHSEFSAAAPVSLTKINSLRKKIGKIKNVQLISLHITGCYTRLKQAGYGYVPCGRRMPAHEIMCNAISNISELRAGVADKAAFAFENNNYFDTGAYEIISDPFFLIELIKRTNVKFVFDISHAMISRINGDFSIEPYFKKDFISRIIQVHISNYGLKGGIAMDAHEVPDKNIWEVLLRVVRSAPNLKYLTLEYYKDEKKLLDNLLYIRKKIIKT